MDCVPRPWLPPGHCILSMKSEDNDGFIDTGLTMYQAFSQTDEGRIYASVSVIREYARKLHMIDGHVHDATVNELAVADARIVELEQQLADAERDFAAIERLETRDFIARRKTGRPKQAA